MPRINAIHWSILDIYLDCNYPPFLSLFFIYIFLSIKIIRFTFKRVRTVLVTIRNWLFERSALTSGLSKESISRKISLPPDTWQHSILHYYGHVRKQTAPTIFFLEIKQSSNLLLYSLYKIKEKKKQGSWTGGDINRFDHFSCNSFEPNREDRRPEINWPVEIIGQLHLFSPLEGTRKEGRKEGRKKRRRKIIDVKKKERKKERM